MWQHFSLQQNNEIFLLLSCNFFIFDYVLEASSNLGWKVVTIAQWLVHKKLRNEEFTVVII